MEDKRFIDAIETIISALEQRGYNAYSQIYGNLEENDPLYITSYKGARDIIQDLDKSMIKQYISKVKGELV